ncbi:cbb3-type cytochrome c oxidase subunit I [Truepera radiovictrix]|uniref:Cytochrome c oxidase subunit I n=1 Tax=Truepera radiovictrix (strain DSM 17093 / CIP 108686 / LMG 22925 / RQ-24) TaxID=649638 RepID=D7CXL5_TRURR|nr:cbb3-type cytochrome c oxidase subunit I [Truepera radiovictrix]ADI14617.1 cytochrome c oxidase subunit I [Truepera radiovictrix DSM 17093]WMT56833.1 cbb3-type cytochrome c oxidase subunit I [Truepera radiovictrix]
MAVSTAALPHAATAHPEKRVTLAFLLTGLLALLVGALLGPFQALNYAGINLYDALPFLRSYYQGLTLHGVLNAFVFTTFFISGILLYLPARELDLRPDMTLAWGSYVTMLLGLVLAAWAVLSNTSTVLYTFYPPLQGHWAFYLGLTLVVLASTAVGFETIRLRARWKRQNPDKVTPLVTYMSVVTWLMWWLATTGIVLEMVFLLLPWSFGLIGGVDPELARTLFWWTGHPIVYFWVLPAYVSWYALLPRQAGGELVSDSLARLAFIMFLLFSVPVGFHHQFTDPGVPAPWKITHSLLTMMVGIPSLLTAFTVGASLELGGRRRGGRGVLGWIPKLPWRDPSFTAQVLAMVSFIFGGAGGIVLASFNLNILLHNTAWVPGHFHITVGTATTLTFLGLTFWLVPHLTKKPLFAPRMALASAWAWFGGMMIFAFGMHWQGYLAVPRRAQISALTGNWEGAYANAAVPMFFTGLSGVVLLTAVLLYFTVLFGTLFSRRKLPDGEVPAIPFSRTVALRSEGVLRVMDTLRAWFALAVLLVIVAYGPTVISMWLDQLPVPGVRYW